MEKIVIIGNGIAGITVARHIRKNSDNEMLVISAESEHFFSRTALMYVYMGHMRFQDIKPYEDWFWKKNRIDLMHDYVESIDVDNQTLKMRESAEVKYDKLVIASGSKPNFFGWPGENLKGVQGLYSKQDLELLEENSVGAKSAVVVGGGLIGVEFAEMLLSRGIKVHYIVRESEFGGSYLPNEQAQIISNHVREHHVNLMLSTTLDSIIDNGEGKVGGIVTSNGEEIACDIVGLCVGVSPNIEFVQESGIECEKGILVDHFMQTSAKNVYAIGDCAQFRDPLPGRRAIDPIWYTGRIMGENLAQTLCGNAMKYSPGHWFNSAKFFDIEYQTYGMVFSEPREGETSFHWQSADGKKSVYLVWEKDTNKFLGINVLGLRMRHELFDKWLSESASIQEVLSDLRQANFDPEFYKRHEEEIIVAFNAQTGMNVELNSKKWWRKVLAK